jgi:hypothetical protein
MNVFQMHGWPTQSIDGDTMCELSDLAITASPDALRLFSNFLVAIAGEIEAGELRNSHIHIGMRVPEWKKLCPTVDIQIINTNYSGPAAVLPE